MEQNREPSPVVNPQTCGTSVIYNKGAKATQQQAASVDWRPTCKPRDCNIPTRKPRKKASRRWIWQWLLTYNKESTGDRSKRCPWDYIKLKGFAQPKKRSMKQEGSLRMGENTCKPGNCRWRWALVCTGCTQHSLRRPYLTRQSNLITPQSDTQSATYRTRDWATFPSAQTHPQ